MSFTSAHANQGRVIGQQLVAQLQSVMAHEMCQPGKRKKINSNIELGNEMGFELISASLQL